MNINDLTIGQVRELSVMLNASPDISKPSPFIGRHVIVRAYSAGVHAGELVSQDGDIVVLKDSRRLWNWEAKSGVALSGVAVHGIDAKNSKVDVVVKEICIIGVCEIIPTTDTSHESIISA
jgi:hypothetical protein